MLPLWQHQQDRRTARRSLIGFTRYTKPDFFAARHHVAIAEHLEAVERGDIDRLIIETAPRHGKSELVSKRFPAYYIGRHPERQAIITSGDAELAIDFGREVRNIVRSEEFADIFDNVRLALDATAAHRWNTNHGGVYISASVGGNIMGRGAHLFMIDDPIKDRDQANSPIERERIWTWYRNTVYTRLMAKAAIVVTATRWHTDDLTGRLLEQEKRGGDRWTVLSLPAIAEEGDALGRQVGEALWTEGPEELAWPLERLLRTKAVLEDPRDWLSLYQQRPLPEEGDFFKAEWFRYYDAAPKHLRIYGASDYAVTAAGGDWTVHLVVGVDPEDNIYLLDMWRDRTASDRWVESWIDICHRWEPTLWAEEGGQIEKGVGPFLTKRAFERKCYVYRTQFTSARDKPTRAQAIRGRMANGKVYFPRRADWLDEFVAEMLLFPGGKTDDQVDALSLIGRMLAKLAAAQVPKPKPDSLAILPEVLTLESLFSEHERELGDGRRI